MKNKFKTLINKLTIYKYKILNEPTLKQEILLRLALKEKGFNLQKLKIKCDHDLGLNYVNEIKLEIKYPESFFNKASSLIPENKNVNFYFNGNMDESGEREQLLKPFQKLSKSVIISSNQGRVIAKKGKFNKEYFKDLASAKFGLCPHQSDWPGTKKYMWTYRFIESCFVCAIPVVFKSTPLGAVFINGFYFVWDNEVISDWEKIYKDISKHAENNRLLAKERFCLTKKECSDIKNSFL